jgi:hypothetical protein
VVSSSWSFYLPGPELILQQTQTAPVPYSVVSSLDAELCKCTSLDLLELTASPRFSTRDPSPFSTYPGPASGHFSAPSSRKSSSLCIGDQSDDQVIHRLGIRLQVAQTRLLLNRPSFARALKDRPEDPSRSKVGASFFALYESALEIVQLVKQLVIYHPSLIARW